jgi:predicted ATP-grasp superfamily ATP-dependent carboligase
MDAVILGASPNALSAARSLGRAGLQVVLAAAGSNRTFDRSRYVARFVDLEHLDDDEITACLMSLPGPKERPFLLATGDRYALFLAKQQDLLASKYCFVTPTYAALDAIIDKAKLYQTAKRSGFRHPRFHVVADPQDIEAAIANVPTPCYVKPALAHEWRPFKNTKVERADTQVALRHILETFIERGLVAVPQEMSSPLRHTSIVQAR